MKNGSSNDSERKGNRAFASIKLYYLRVNALRTEAGLLASNFMGRNDFPTD